MPWIADSFNAATVTTVASLSSITCPLTTKCLVAGTGALASPATSGALLLYGPTAGPLSAEFPLASSATVTSVSQVTCPSLTTCAALATNASGPVIFTLTINSTNNLADTWHSDGVPNGGGTVSTLSQAVCPAAAACLIMAAGTLLGSPAGFLISTTNLGGPTTWAAAILPSQDQVLYFDDIDCTLGASGTCSAVGATPTGAVVLTSATGPGASGGWSDQTPTGLSGTVALGVPIEISNTSLNSGLAGSQTSVNAVTAGASPNAPQLPVLFPFQGGYSMFAGDCPGESNAYNVALATTIPGGVSGSTVGMASPTVPLGLLSVKVTSPTTGLPHSSVTLQLKATAVAGCGTDTYNLQTTGVDGLSRIEVPFGSYSLYVNGSSTAYGTAVVAGNSVVLTLALVGSSTFVLPTPVAVGA